MFKHLTPRSIEGQMTVTLALSFSLLLAVLAAFEVLEYDNVEEWARSDFTASRLARIKPIIESIRKEDSENYTAAISRCHDGYTLSKTPHAVNRETEKTNIIAREIAKALSLETERVRAGFVTLTREDFSYSDCAASEIKFPLEGIVISLQLASGQWLNAEVHPHEWHFTPTMTDWLIRSGAAFILIGAVALLFVRRLSKPINSLTSAAKKFGEGLELAEVDETGPYDVKRAIRSFNAMQRQVTEEVTRRTNMLTAISHDIRSPLTALRVKAELIDAPETKSDLISSIEKMERMTAAALAFLKGESRHEPKRKIDLCALVESECVDFKEIGAEVSLSASGDFHYACRPDALARAVRNLIENAVKYAGGANVSLHKTEDCIEITVSDNGPGIPDGKLNAALEPFERLSTARESDKGGFGLGLAIAKAVTEGHDGVFTLTANTPNGLIARIRLPLEPAAKQ